MENKEIYVSNGKRPLWQSFIAALLFTLSLYLGYLFFQNFEVNPGKNYKSIASPLELAIICFAGAIGFSRVVDYRFNLKAREYRVIYNFGLLNFGKTYQFNSVDYIAVYFNNSKEVYEVNLWYNTNKHFAMIIFNDANEGLKAGETLAKKLQLDLWDATNPHDGKWVDLNDLIVRD